MTRISLIDRPGFEALRRAASVDPQEVRALRTALLKRFFSDEQALAECSPRFREAIASGVQLHPLELFRRVDSEQDGATKLLFRTSRGTLLETVVLRIATGRTALCLSSQVGCAAACAFCATGKMGIAQNLTAAEIVDQVVQAGQLLAVEGRKPRNLVFMGMGEPLHNEEHLYAALATLQAPELLHHPPRRILVSTVGLPDAMLRLVRRFPAVQLALSLHAVHATQREALIPLARKFPLEQLRAAVRGVNGIQPPRTSVMIEYLMLAGVNDSLDDARALARWLEGLRVHVNLIPYNPIDEAPQLRATEREQRDAFAAVLRDAGYATTIRYSLGADIAAACGQLVKRSRGASA